MVVQRIIFTWFVLSLWEKMYSRYCCAFFTLSTFVSLFLCYSVSLFLCFSVLVLQFGVSLFSLSLCFCLSLFINFYVLCAFSFLSISISGFFLSFFFPSVCFVSVWIYFLLEVFVSPGDHVLRTNLVSHEPPTVLRSSDF